MENKKVTLSVAIAVYNEEKNLEACLASIAPVASEIVIVDGGSTDHTIEIAQKFKAKIIRTDNPPIFHINKQKALDACTGDWILQLDADEVIPEDLKKEIMSTIESGPRVNGYYIPRKNYFWGHWMRKGGQYPDPVIRLVRRGKGRFPKKTVHEQIEVDGAVEYLKNPVDHFSYRTREDYWRKADAYTTLAALEMKKNGVRRSLWTWFAYNIIKPKMTFLSLFIRHKGFMDGWYGFLFAYFSALHFPIIYKKFMKLCQLEADRPLAEKKLLTFLFLFIICFSFTSSVYAEYVLPYPSFMPGNKIYRVSRFIDELKKYWYFGRIAQEKYHLSLTDKYLVEAKTLFEYKQYLLASDALLRSDREFRFLPASKIVLEAAQKHKEVLQDIQAGVPAVFSWTPEKTAATTLKLRDMIESSIDLRDTIATAAAY